MSRPFELRDRTTAEGLLLSGGTGFFGRALSATRSREC